MKVGKHEVIVDTKEQHGATWVVGTVDGREVIALGNGTDAGWTVGSSATMPRDLEKARAVLACMNKAFAVVDVLRVQPGVF